MEITLNDTELRIAQWLGERRYENRVKQKADPGQGPSGRDGDARHHIRGVECEMAAAIMVNVYYRLECEHIDRVDIGGVFGVRSTVLPYGRLIVKPKDKVQPVVLIYKFSRNLFQFRGWQWSDVVRRDWPLETGEGRDPAHYAEQRALRKLEELEELRRKLPMEVSPCPSASP